MNKKVIFSNTIMFIFMVIFIVVFKIIFGDANTLIGVTTATAMLMLLQKDLTLSPIKNTLLLILLNLFIGASATLASMNMWIGIPVNFIAMFILSYSLCYNLRNPMYLPFSLQYLFILVTPVKPDELPMRFLSLIVGAIIIMLVQLLANRNNVSKKGNKLLVKICNDIIDKITVSNLENRNLLSESIKQSIGTFRSIIYNKREKRFYLTEESKIKLNISVALEKISLLLDQLDYSKNENLLSILEQSLSKISNLLNNEETLDKVSFDEMKNYRNEYLDNLTDSTDLQIISNILFIYESLYELNKLGIKHYNLINEMESIPKTFKLNHNFALNYKAKSAKFSYAVRVAIGVSLAAFIMDYFHLSEGRWIVFTMLSLINPIYEVSKTKTKDRIFATIIGVIILEVLFLIFKDVITRTLILMLAGYISSYLKEYRYSTICTTISAIGAASLLGSPNSFALNRLLFVCIGAVLAILINKLILPYSLEKDIAILKTMYTNVINEMVESLEEVYSNKSRTKMDNLFIVTSFIEDRLKADNILNDNNLVKIIDNERMLICSIYQLYIQLSNSNIKDSNLKVSLHDLRKCLSTKNYSAKVENFIKKSVNFEEKLLLSNILEISTSINNLNPLTN
ncbi:FUSC family protein [Clostridium sp. B9]|uniref:FUSC family protein n=1 Tax=Clostridium sp. B9 TaxID=3423224 RepID=UPI003D2EA8FA